MQQMAVGNTVPDVTFLLICAKTLACSGLKARGRGAF